MNRSFTKIRKIQEANMRLEQRRLLSEQTGGFDCNYFIEKKKGTFVYDGGGNFSQVDGQNVSSGLPFELGPGFGRGEQPGTYNYEYKFGPTLRKSAGEHYLEGVNEKGKVTIYLSNCKTQKDTTDQEEVKTITNKIATEGIKNVLPKMISDPPFSGEYSGYVINGQFDGINYAWDCSGVEGMSGVRGIIKGKIITENNSYLLSDDKGAVQIGVKDDANPKGVIVGFVSQSSKFIIYYSKDNKYKCKYF